VLNKSHVLFVIKHRSVEQIACIICVNKSLDVSTMLYQIMNYEDIYKCFILNQSGKLHHIADKPCLTVFVIYNLCVA